MEIKPIGAFAALASLMVLIASYEPPESTWTDTVITTAEQIPLQAETSAQTKEASGASSYREVTAVIRGTLTSILYIPASGPQTSD